MDLPRLIEWTESLWHTALAGNRDLFGKGIRKLINECGHDVSQPNIEPDLEKLGYCPKCGIRPCDCANLFDEEKAG